MRSAGGNIARGALLAMLVLGPLLVVLDRLGAAGDLTLFVLAGVAQLAGSPAR